MSMNDTRYHGCTACVMPRQLVHLNRGVTENRTSSDDDPLTFVRLAKDDKFQNHDYRCKDGESKRAQANAEQRPGWTET